MKLSLRNGFTLLELLLVVAVLAILAVLGFGALRGMNDRRDEQICQTNLRQVYLLLQSYVADHAGRYPPALSNVDGDITLHWRRAILPYMQLNSAGDGLDADVFKSGLTCPTMNRSTRANPDFAKLCNFGVNEKIGDPHAPLERGILASQIRNPSRLFLATESVFKSSGLPRETIYPKDFNTYAREWGYHRNNRQNVLFADGHIEVFTEVRRLIMDPLAVGKTEDAWTP